MFHTVEKIKVIALLMAFFSTSFAVPLKNPTTIKHYENTELLFEKNIGQYDKEINFLSKGSGYNIALGRLPVIELFQYKTTLKNYSGDLDATKRTSPQVVNHAIFQIELINANKHPKIQAEKEVSTTINYLTGLKSKWKTNIPNYAQIRYKNILKNIDVTYYGTNGKLEYDFILKPSASVSDIQLRFIGATGIKINKQGQLNIFLDEIHINQAKPIAYQLDKTGQKIIIAAQYKRLNNNAIGFEIGHYDKSKELIIDPVLEYSRYYGGSKYENVEEMGLDNDDNIYLIGHSDSPNLATSGSYQQINNPLLRDITLSANYCPDCTDLPPNQSQVIRHHIEPPSTSTIYITKLSPDGNNVIWSTYFAHPQGKALDIGFNSVAVSASGEVAFGLKNLAPEGLPLVNPTQIYSATQANTYIAKFNSAGNDLVFSTYLSLGTTEFMPGYLRGLDIAVDGSVAATGFVFDYNGGIANIDFPEINPISGQDCHINTESFVDVSDGWVIYFNNLGTATFASCLGGSVRQGGSSLEWLRGVKIGSNGHLYVVGLTSAIDFPVVNPIQPSLSFNSDRNITLTEIDPANSQIVFSTYIGPTSAGRGYDYKYDFDPDINNPASIYPYDLQLDSSGDVLITGTTNGTGWRTKNAFQTNLATFNDVPLINTFSKEDLTDINYDLFLTKINPNNASIVYSTYLGGHGREFGYNKLAVDNTGNSYIVALSNSTDYPTLNATQATKPGRTSAVISKFSPNGALLFSSYLGGTDSRKQINSAGGIAINSANKIIVATDTFASDFPIVGSPTSYLGGLDATLSIFNQLTDIDTDGDGVIDTIDAFPANASEWRDTDLDTIGNNIDLDDDGDLTLDDVDDFPLDSSEITDSDADGIGNNTDGFPYDTNNLFDNDGNGEGDFTEEDADKDGIINTADFNPFNVDEWYDTDKDGIGNFTDLDDDNDGIEDGNDVAPLDPNNPVMTFNNFNATNTAVFKSPLPPGFSHLNGSDVKWTSADDQGFNNSTSLSTLEIDDNQSAGLKYEEVFEAGTLSFQYKVDSEYGADFIVFSIDGVIQLIDSGQIGWTLFSTPISAGQHTLTWQYSKNSSISTGTDTAWIDQISGIPVPAVDLAISVTDTNWFINVNNVISFNYYISVSNLTNIATGNARVQINLPLELIGTTWLCNIFNDTASSCQSAYDNNPVNSTKANGVGDVDLTIDLDAFGSTNFLLYGSFNPQEYDGTLELNAYIEAGNQIRETNLENNSISHSRFLGIFKNSFE